jgi:hypothetical protein
MPEIVYGVKEIARVTNEQNLRVVYYRLEKGYVPGAWKAGKTWALTVPVFRASAGLEVEAA